MSKPNEPMIIDMLRLKNNGLKGAHYVDLVVRKDGVDVHYEADWLDEALSAYFQLYPDAHEHKWTIDLGDPCYCGSDNCARCEICFEDKHD